MSEGVASRRPNTRSIALTAAALVATLVAAEGFRSESPDLKTWPEGPVRYIITHEELKAFRRLENDAERSKFIDVFWRRRDPIPETAINEYRGLFWSRVREANDHFSDTATPGWKTDRGRIHLLCGPPSRVEEDTNADVTRSAPTAGHGLVRWIYEGRPCGRTDMGPVAIVAFARSVSGEYELSTDPRLSALVFNVNDFNDPTRMQMERYMDMLSPPTRSALDVMMDLGKLQEVAHPEEILLDRVETIESYGSHPLVAQVDRFRHPRGGTLLVITVALPASAGDSLAIMARLQPRDAGKANRLLAEESFKFQGAGPQRVAQARLVVEPGSYELTLLAAEASAANTGIYKGTIEVRAPSSELQLSDVVLARTLSPVEYAALVTYDEAYFLGAFRVVPRVGTSVARGETVELFHEIYGGVPPFRISYQLEGKENDGRFTPLGRPSVQEQPGISAGWSAPVAENWPLGDYRVRIHVQDSKDASVDAFAPFTVVAP